MRKTIIILALLVSVGFNAFLLFHRDKVYVQQEHTIMEQRMNLEFCEDIKKYNYYYFDGLSSMAVLQSDVIAVDDSVRMDVFFVGYRSGEEFKKRYKPYTVLGHGFDSRSKEFEEIIDTVWLDNMRGTSTFKLNQLGVNTIEGVSYMMHNGHEMNFPFSVQVIVEDSVLHN
jgi:hypothetical protein